MHGNAWEWVADCWNDDYSRFPPTDGNAWTTGDCTNRVLRGGSWADKPRGVRSANRGWKLVDKRKFNYGFRLARTPDR